MIDFCNTEDAPILVNDIDIVIQQIDMLFDTADNEVLGDEEYGSEFESLLYDISASDSYIERYVEGVLEKIDKRGYSISVKASTHEGTLNDIILIRITLKRGDEAWQKIYNIS